MYFKEHLEKWEPEITGLLDENKLFERICWWNYCDEDKKVVGITLGVKRKWGTRGFFKYEEAFGIEITKKSKEYEIAHPNINDLTKIIKDKDLSETTTKVDNLASKLEELGYKRRE